MEELNVRETCIICGEKFETPILGQSKPKCGECLRRLYLRSCYGTKHHKAMFLCAECQFNIDCEELTDNNRIAKDRKQKREYMRRQKKNE